MGRGGAACHSRSSGTSPTSDRRRLQQVGDVLADDRHSDDHTAVLVDEQIEAWKVPTAEFLVVQGCVTREIVIRGETAAMEFLAEGDLLRPTGEAGSTSVASEVVWQVLEPTRLAVRDGDLLFSVQPWPEVTAQLLRRQDRRAEWLSNVFAISHLPCVELRVLVLFWEFADRWGKVRSGE